MVDPPTPYPPHEKVAIALSVLGSREGRIAEVVLDEVELILRGATTEEITLTRHLAFGVEHGR